MKIPEMVLRAAIRAAVARLFDGFTPSFNRTTKDASAVEKKEAALFVIGLIEDACREYLAEARKRAEALA